MSKRFKIRFPVAEISVRVKIPEVDQTKADARNIRAFTIPIVLKK